MFETHRDCFVENYKNTWDENFPLAIKFCNIKFSSRNSLSLSLYIYIYLSVFLYILHFLSLCYIFSFGCKYFLGSDWCFPCDVCSGFSGLGHLLGHWQQLPTINTFWEQQPLKLLDPSAATLPTELLPFVCMCGSGNWKKWKERGRVLFYSFFFILLLGLYFRGSVLYYWGFFCFLTLYCVCYLLSMWIMKMNSFWKFLPSLPSSPLPFVKCHMRQKKKC